MADLLAIVSKAEFDDKHRGAKVGDVLAIDRYVSKNPRLASLASGGSLFLVTVRPPDEALWLVGILERPAHDGTAWISAKNETAVRDIGPIKSSLVFESGKGLVAKPGALGMALQTPRALAAADIALLRGGASAPTAPAGEKKEAPARERKAKKPSAPVVTSAPTPPAAGTATAPLDFDFDPSTFRLVDLDEARAAAAAELHRRIVADPEDADARRILADLYLDVGDSRGTYIQLAMRLDELHDADPDRPALERAVTSLERRGALAWSRDLRRVATFNEVGKEWGHTKFGFWRGFVETITGASKEVLGDLDAAVAVAPIRRLELRDCRATDLTKLAGLGALEKIRHLSLRLGEDAPKGLRELFASPRLAGLRSLEVQGKLTPASAEQLAASPALATLERLTFKSEGTFGIGAEGLRALIDGGRLESLSSLHLAGQQLGAAGSALLGAFSALTTLTLADDTPQLGGVQAIVAAPFASKLRSLTLSRCELSDKGALALVRGAPFPVLRVLDIGGSAPGSKKIGAWLDAFELPSVEVLSLAASHLRVDGAKALAATTKLGRIRRLDVARNSFKHEGATILAGATGFGALTELDISGNIIDAVGFRALAAGPFMRRVRELDIVGNKCGTEGGKELAKWSGLPSLESLSLNYNWMGVLGIRAMLEQATSLRRLVAGPNNYGSEPVRSVASGACPGLQYLHSYEADPRQAAALADAPAARTLETLHLGQMAVDASTAEAITKLPSLGQLRLVFCTPTNDGAALLRKRFGPFLELWGHIDTWNKHPGPA